MCKGKTTVKEKIKKQYTRDMMEYVKGAQKKLCKRRIKYR